MKLSKKKIIGIIVAVIILLMIAIGVVYAKTDLFKSSKTLFYKHLIGNVEELNSFNYDEFLKTYKSLSESSYTANGDIGLHIDTNETSLKEVADIFNLGKITYEIKSLPLQNKSYEKVGLNYKNEELIKAELLGNKDQYGLKISEIVDEYISIENNNLKELAKKLGMDEEMIPDRIENINIYDFLNISKKDRNTIFEKYKKIIDKEISKDHYTVKKNVDVRINDENIKTNAYTLTLTEKETMNILIKLYEELKADDLTLDLLVEKANMLSYINIEEDKLNKQDIQDELAYMIESMQEELEYADNDSKMEIIVYAKNNKTVRTEILFDGEGIAIDKYKKENYNIFEIKEKAEYAQDITATIEYRTEKEGDTTSFIANIIIDDGYSKYEIGIESKNKGKVGIGKTEASDIISFKMSGLEARLTINEYIEYTDNFEIEDFNEVTAKLNDMAQEELAMLFNEIGQKAETVLKEKLEKLGIEDTDILGASNENVNNKAKNAAEDTKKQAEMEQKYLDIMEEYIDGKITLEEAQEQINKLEV